jgi:hypothetical protein
MLALTHPELTSHPDAIIVSLRPCTNYHNQLHCKQSKTQNAYALSHPELTSHPDAIIVASTALIMCNGFLHNPRVKPRDRMSLQLFLKIMTDVKGLNIDEGTVSCFFLLCFFVLFFVIACHCSCF